MAPDGVERMMLVVNNQYPGPPIEADWGDELVIHVQNNLKDNGYLTSVLSSCSTSIHWHGVLQEHNAANDGVPGVSQCPIPPGSSFTYRFRATSYGTSWYHSHFSLQYSDGVLGPIVIRGPSSANWDVDLGAVVLTDWLHETAFSEFFVERLPGPPIPADNGLINGKNKFNGSGSYSEFTFEAGKKYRMRLINTSTNTHFKFWLDEHVMTVQGADFVAMEPYETEILDIAIGMLCQRQYADNRSTL
jgi:FtsP/CotA-like multicopper oxidase with cupredoxin domain